MSSYQWHWQRLWDVLNGEYPPAPPQEIPLITSLCYYSLTIFTGRLLRLGVKNFAPKTLHPFLYDFITTFQCLACSLENGQIRKHYGTTAYLITLMIIGMYSMVTIENGSANPGSHLIKYMKEESGAFRTVISILVQLSGGLLSYRYARLFWYLELTESHGSRYRMLHCVTDLNVPSSLGFAIEYGATFLDCIIWFNTFSKFHLTEMVTKCFFGAYMTVLGVDLTGWYMNPLNATNQNFGCHGTTMLEHLMVYWLAPMSAVVTAVIIQRHVDRVKRNLLQAPCVVSALSDNNNKDTEGQFVNDQNGYMASTNGSDVQHIKKGEYVEKKSSGSREKMSPENMKKKN